MSCNNIFIYQDQFFRTVSSELQDLGFIHGGLYMRLNGFSLYYEHRIPPKESNKEQYERGINQPKNLG